MWVKKLVCMLLVAVLVVGFLPYVNATPMLIADDTPDPDRTGNSFNAEIDFFKMDDDDTWLYFYIITPGTIDDGYDVPVCYIVDFRDPNPSHWPSPIYWRVWGLIPWDGFFNIVDSDLEASTDGSTYFGGYNLGEHYDVIFHNLSTILLKVVSPSISFPTPPGDDTCPNARDGTYGTQIP